MKKLGDTATAATVVVCSAIMLVALAFALGGNPFRAPGRTLRTQFTDITGIQQSSLVKYAGAPAGTVHSIRMLSPSERTASENPANTVELVLALNRDVPDLNEGLVASVASDTLLADKFILLDGGNPSAPVLANGAMIPSITPVTFDHILRDLNSTLAGIDGILAGGADGGLSRIRETLDQLNAAITEARALISGASSMVEEGRGLVKNGNQLLDEAGDLVGDGRSLIAETREPLKSLLAELSSAADSLDDMAKRADALVKNNEGNLNTTIVDARKAVADLKVAAASARELIDSLKARPQQIIWGPGRQRRTEQQQR
jgi:ABC-type transport system involved in resistance to organic solvents, periplasmic component